MKRIFRSKIFWILLFLIVAVRLVLPPLIKPKLNEFLAEFSPTFKGHVDDVGISLLRGAFQMRGLELRLKDESNERFVHTNFVETSIAWRDLLQGRITTDVLVDGSDIVLTKKVLNAFKSTSKSERAETKEKAGKLFPLKIERIDIRDSSFEFAELASIPDSQRWRVSDIEARISNATPGENFPLTLVSMDGKMFKSTDLKVAGQLNQLSKPTAWDLDIELRDFDMRESNSLIKQKVPLSFTTGKLDAYSEIKSENNNIVGYIKPFLKNADIVANRESFKDFKNFGIEVGTAAANLILRDAKNRTLATKVLFSYNNGDFKINSMEALAKAFQNGFADDLPRGIDDEISLSAKQTKADLKGEKP